ncbi:Phage lysozyme [Vibrio aerogenes CECT 7868]|uniref:Lysozyme n=1 Tax=Vibrio aerogenes CECT 7868 TaxID=1216006 RepID=A0A1M5Z6K1_9VIBR|nr:glycoside hydrolase family protein [Vibrio aerogenes]SHI19849.1 Phage lysozyme [Vibrio aerogenes CECT 7868]
MKLTEQAIQYHRELLIRHEGLRLQPYRCTAGKLTIGVGRNLDDAGISEAEAMLLLEHDLQSVYQQVNDALPWCQALPECQQIVLMNMAFNLGMGGLLKFKRMLAALEAGDTAQAATEMRDSRWAAQVGKRAEDLIQLLQGNTDV